MILAVLLAVPGVALAIDPTPFTVIGPIEKFTLNAPTDPVCGPVAVAQALTSAHMTVHGVDVLIPCNLIIQMPATYLTADDVFKKNPGGPGESGLALADATQPLAAFEATVIGNIVNVLGSGATYVAALVYISQHSLATGSGYIKSIDLTAREMRVGADPAAPVSAQDARVRLNDAEGVYDHHPSPVTVDERFTVDTENPTVHAATGFPMCLPSGASDPKCPAANRPTAGGKALTNFVMGTVGLAAAPPDALPIPPCPACDARLQAPFVVGDYVTWSGTLAKDGAGIYISAHTLVANVGIFTAPGTTPAYVSLDETLIGALGPLTPRNPPTSGSPTLPQETQDRFRVEGFTTDPSRNVELYAIDVNPVTGAETLRLLNVVRPQSVPFGRFRLTVGKRAGILFDAAGNVKGATRELMARVQNGPSLQGQPVPEPVPPAVQVAGQYVAPVGEYIFPENTVLGDPLVPNNFECLAFLQLGSGPLTTNGHSGPVVSRLAPWPGPFAAPGPVNCSL